MRSKQPKQPTNHDVPASSHRSDKMAAEARYAGEVCSEEDLINEVEKYPWLWNARRLDYKDAVKRANSWHAIGIAVDLLMEAYSTEVEDIDEATEPDNGMECTNDTTLDDLAPSSTCEVLLQLERDHQPPRPSQLEPASAGTSCEGLSPLQQPAPDQQPPPAQQPAPAEPAPHPPARRRARRTGPPQPLDSSALLNLIAESTRQMANAPLQQQLDVTDPLMAFTVHLCQELRRVHPDELSDTKFNLLKLVHESQKRRRDHLNDE
ncbi:hypothetical protein ISCGN_019510 [Ixodes scapularis]